jgi:hypothetical protein
MLKRYGILSIALLSFACNAKHEEVPTLLNGITISYDGAPDLEDDTVFQLQTQVSDAVNICQLREGDASQIVMIDCLRVELGEGFHVSVENE